MLHESFKKTELRNWFIQSEEKEEFGMLILYLSKEDWPKNYETWFDDCLDRFETWYRENFEKGGD